MLLAEAVGTHLNAFPFSAGNFQRHPFNCCVSLIQHDVSGHLKQLGKGVIGFGKARWEAVIRHFYGFDAVKETFLFFFSRGRKSERKDGEMIEKSQSRI